MRPASAFRVWELLYPFRYSTTDHRAAAIRPMPAFTSIGAMTVHELFHAIFGWRHPPASRADKQTETWLFAMRVSAVDLCTARLR